MKKKRLRSCAQVVSFDDNLVTSPAAEVGEEAVPQSPFSPFSTCSGDDSFLFNPAAERGRPTAEEEVPAERSRAGTESRLFSDPRPGTETGAPRRNDSSASLGKQMVWRNY